MLLRTPAQARVSPSRRQQWERHLLSCTDCLDYYAARCGTSKQESSQLGAAIIAATSGDNCDTARLMLAANLDKDNPGEGEIDTFLQAHVDDCPSCQSVATSMERLTQQLSPLQSLKPPAGFTATVLSRTSGKRISASRRWSMSILVDLVRRPRFAAEAAFTLTLIWVLIFDLPVGLFTTIANAEQINLKQVIGSARTSIDTEVRELEPVIQDHLQTFVEFSNQLMVTGTRRVDQAGEFASQLQFRINEWALRKAPDNETDSGDIQ